MKLKGENIDLLIWEGAYCTYLREWYTSGDYPYFFRNVFQMYTLDDLKLAPQILGGDVFVVANKEQETCGLVGVVDYRPIPRTCKFMALIDRDFQGQGYMLEALQLLHERMFGTFDIRAAYVDVGEFDDRTNALALEAGYSEVGAIDYCVVDGVVQREIRYELQRKHYKEMYMKEAE